MNRILNVVLLEQDNYFVYYSDTELESKILIEIELLFEFPKIHHPIKIIETSWTSDLFEIDKYVKKYMMKYGIDKVRGGSYILPILHDFQRQSLQSEFAYLRKALIMTDFIPASNFTDVRSTSSKFASEKTTNTFDPCSPEFANASIYNLYNEEKMRYFLYNTLQTHDNNVPIFINYFEKYNNIHKNLDSIQTFQINNKTYKIDKTILQKINVLIQKISQEPELFMDNDITSSSSFGSELSTKMEISSENIISIYKNTIIYIKHVLHTTNKNHSSTYNEYMDCIKTDIPNVYFSYPHFLLDKYFLHKTTNIVELKQIQEFLYIIEGMFYWINNKIDEYMFDLENIPENVEWKYSTALYYIPFIVNGK